MILFNEDELQRADVLYDQEKDNRAGTTEPLPRFWVTFGSGHKPYENCYVTFSAKNAEDAREAINVATNGIWARMYNSAAGAGVDKWNLRKVTLAELYANPPRRSE